jgi:FKBP-type peptidyl-prolyl cis-trans isomerase 2
MFTEKVFPFSLGIINFMMRKRKEKIMAQAENGDSVKIHYTGKLEDGTVFDSSVNREPLQFTIGEGRIIPGFEKAIIGMNPGESKIVKIPSDEAYGPHRPELVAEIERSQFPEDMKLEAGKEVKLRQPDGRIVSVKIINMTEAKVTLDANHPLAGKELSFDIELVDIV